MKRLFCTLLAVAALGLGASAAYARDYVEFSIGGPDFGVRYSDRHHFVPDPIYWEPRPVYVEPRGYYYYQERPWHHYPRHVHPRRVCPPGYHYVPAHYNRWGHWRPASCRHW